MLKLVVVCIGMIVIISELIGKNPFTVLAGLGAGAAVLMLVFQDFYTHNNFSSGVKKEHCLYAVH